MTRKPTVAFLAAWIFCGSAALAIAGEPPIAAFANDADVVIRLKNPKQTIERAAEMAGTADEKLAGQVRDNAPFIGVLISNPALAGVDQEQDWLVVVFADAKADPAVVFCIPATDPAVMQAALPAKMQKFARDGWVYYSEDAATIEGLQKSTPAGDASIAAEIDSESKELFNRGDISVFLNVDHLTEVYKEQLEKGSGDFARQLNRQAGMLNMVPGADVGSAVDDSAAAGRAILKDTRAFTTAIAITRTGLNVETLGQFKDGSSTAQAMAGHPGHALANIAKLPEGGVLYFGLSSSLSQGFQDKLTSSTAIGEPMDEQQQKLEDLKKQLADVTYKSFALSLGIGHREEGVLRIASITEATPTDKIREFSAAAADLMDVELAGQGIKQETTYEREAETAAGRPVDVLTVTTTVDPNVNPFFGSILTQATAFLFGPRGTETRFAYWDDKYLGTMGGGPEAMEAAVKSLEGTGTNGAEKFREGLLPEPNVLVLLDVQRIAYRALKAASEMPELNLPIDSRIVGTQEPAPSYIGFSIATEPDALRSKTQVPSEQLYRIAQLAIFARMARQQQRNR